MANEPLSPSSRYFRLPISNYVDAAGNTHAYLTRRLLPDPSRFAVLQQYSVVQGDRIDNLSAQFLADPEQFWKLCDANNTLDPAELEEIGRTLLVTLPEGVPAPPGSSGAK